MTNAAGGVGSVTIALLDKLGHRVVASSRAEQERAYLLGLGADEIIDARELSGAGSPSGRGTLGERGGLAWQPHPRQCAPQIQYDGAVAACGLAQGSDLPATVLPFIMRDVTLAGAREA